MKPHALLLIFLAALFLPAQLFAQAGICFSNRDTFTLAYPTPSSLTVADFNGDGIMDIAAAGDNGNKVSVMLGNGTGGFSAAIDYTLAPNSLPGGITHGDFNGDGKMDIATANTNSGTITVLLGNGTGHFGALTNYTVGNNPLSILAADFNGDGKMDLATADFGDDSVSVLLGDGAGGFGTARQFAAGISPFSIASGDFNRDGNTDLAVTNDVSNNITILLGDGAGNFSSTNISVGHNPRSVVVGLFNADTLLDLAVANDGDDNISILLGNGSGGFSSPTNFTTGTFTGPRSVVSADLNGDGKADLATANEGMNTISVLAGDGAGGFSAPVTFFTGNLPRAIVSGHFNADSKIDLATANYNALNVAVLYNCSTTRTESINTHEPMATFNPNPFNESSRLVLPFPAKDATLLLYNCEGRLVKKATHLSGTDVTVNKEYLKAGIYFYRIVEDGNKLVGGQLSVTD